MSLTLSKDELRNLTGYTWPSKQLQELHRQGFWRARRCPVTGNVVLERPHYDAVCRGGDAKPSAEIHRPRVRIPTFRAA